MNRVDLLPDNQLATTLKQIEDELRELKTKQRHSGTSGMLGYFVSNPVEWDITGVVDTADPDDPGYREFDILFIASGKQPFPIENVQLDLRFGGTGESNKPVELPDGQWGWNDGVNFATLWDRNPMYDTDYSGNETQYLWWFGFNVVGTVPYYIKVYVSGSSDGTVEVFDVT